MSCFALPSRLNHKIRVPRFQCRFSQTCRLIYIRATSVWDIGGTSRNDRWIAAMQRFSTTSATPAGRPCDVVKRTSTFDNSGWSNTSHRRQFWRVVTVHVFCLLKHRQYASKLTISEKQKWFFYGPHPLWYLRRLAPPYWNPKCATVFTCIKRQLERLSVSVLSIYFFCLSVCRQNAKKRDFLKN